MLLSWLAQLSRIVYRSLLSHYADVVTILTAFHRNMPCSKGMPTHLMPLCDVASSVLATLKLNTPLYNRFAATQHPLGKFLLT